MGGVIVVIMVGEVTMIAGAEDVAPDDELSGVTVVVDGGITVVVVPEDDVPDDELYGVTVTGGGTILFICCMV